MQLPVRPSRKACYMSIRLTWKVQRGTPEERLLWRPALVGSQRYAVKRSRDPADMCWRWNIVGVLVAAIAKKKGIVLN